MHKGVLRHGRQTKITKRAKPFEGYILYRKEKAFLKINMLSKIREEFTSTKSGCRTENKKALRN